ncbi:MAG: aspartate aminotransferase family protein [Alphaproteobacteria bacterium]|nr:MAG: aspartate aminotransferase family protein [Alphaproteobacteria bacterium]
MSSAVMNVYRRFPVAFVKGEGAWLVDENGRRHLDFCSGIAVTNLGHCHPALVEALCTQAHQLWHTSNLYRIPAQERLAARLAEASGLDCVFFTNSGLEAMECAIKTVRKHFADRGSQRRTIITMEGSFHGRSMATISASGQEKLTRGFEPLLPGFRQVPPEDIAALEAAIDEETAGVLIEPVMGEGGIRALSDQYLQAVRALCDRHGLLLVFDEIQCGMGRTGRLFAWEWAGVRPDVMALAKGLGGGFPVGACLASAKAASGMTPGAHGSTYGGNPLAMAVGHAVLDVLLAPDFLPRLRETAAYLDQALARLAQEEGDLVVERRGKGLMRGLKLASLIQARQFAEQAVEDGILVAPAADNVIRLLPPLIISHAEIDEGMRRLKAALARARRTASGTA